MHLSLHTLMRRIVLLLPFLSFGVSLCNFNRRISNFFSHCTANRKKRSFYMFSFLIWCIDFFHLFELHFVYLLFFCCRRLFLFWLVSCLCVYFASILSARAKKVMLFSLLFCPLLFSSLHICSFQFVFFSNRNALHRNNQVPFPNVELSFVLFFR